METMEADTDIRKQPFPVVATLSLSSTPRSSNLNLFFQPATTKIKNIVQMKLCGNAIDPNATARMDVTILDYINSHCLPFSIAGNPKLTKIIEEARMHGPLYKLPCRHHIGGMNLNALYKTNWKEQLKILLSDGRTFGITIFGDGATIKTVLIVNVLGGSINNPFALLDIANCMAHLAKGEKEDAKHIAKFITPIIQEIEKAEDAHQKKCPGIVALVFIDGATNVQNSGKILKVLFPCITVGHSAKHVVSLFFSGMYTKILNFQRLLSLAK
jgi:hypothetical protein